jgi:ribosomal protein L29
MAKEKETFVNKDEKELKKILAEKREALREFRFSMKGSRVRNTKEGATLRKDIARILGTLTSKNRTLTQVEESTSTE